MDRQTDRQTTKQIKYSYTTSMRSVTVEQPIRVLDLFYRLVATWNYV